RTRIVVPRTVNGFPAAGASLRLHVGVDDDGEIYVDGLMKQRFHWDDGSVELTAHAQPGQTFEIAIRGINGPGNGQLRSATLSYGLLAGLQPGFDQTAQEVDFFQNLMPRLSDPERDRVADALKASESRFDAAALQSGGAHAAAVLNAMRAPLLSLADITRSYEVTYIGHAHIDMNWLWTWPETIDICHRTWASAMKLMGLFPDFGFVQSQPGAYLAIQKHYPEEFARMQAASQRGQWDVVGGLWDESDTNMPSGEALARSLFLGQRYFKANFGRYAQTGWLPDSFGHSWQMPQLLNGAGITNFYHERCGDDIRFSWWRSPDGSKVLKANTGNYDANIEPAQLLEPWDIEQQYGLKRSLVVFGVGDHGGGPTRKQILKGKAFQSDPLLPRVTFSTADVFFKQLRATPAAASLPVVDRDLQYFDEGCYTTHADLKKAERSSENTLYSAEVFSSLAAMVGRPYPVAGLDESWKPTAFAQFHDIMCGSAIHSTYTWMENLLDTARSYARAQTDASLATLTAHVDTRGARAGEQPVVVWNALSFPRADVVSVHVANATAYHSVRDTAGNRYPAQNVDESTLVFVSGRIPGFGYSLYFLSTRPSPNSNLSVRSQPLGFVIENRFVRLRISRDSGLMTELFDKSADRELLRPGMVGNVLQLLGDSGDAWVIRYTGDKTSLTTQGAKVTLLALGPVFAQVRIRHSIGTSTFVQDLTVYDRLPRIDLPTVVDWHEHGVMLKAAFPLNFDHPAARVGIPYGSIARPTNGQENPGQKWMDVSEQLPTAVSMASDLDLRPLFNFASTGNFDTYNRGYAAELLPAPGKHVVGPSGVPVTLARNGAGQDCIACNGQTVPVTSPTRGRTLFLLGASAPSTQTGIVTYVCADGSRTARALILNDWIVNDNPDNAAAFSFAYQRTDLGRNVNTGSKPHLWLVALSLPARQTVTSIILPRNPRMHLFAATIAEAPPPVPVFGLTVLNDCKYGSDTTNSVFRLSLLRSSSYPDPTPDDGEQSFTYSLQPHTGDCRVAGAEQAGLALNVPLQAVVAGSHSSEPGAALPSIRLETADGSNDLVAGALKHSEDGAGYILRFFETEGRNTEAVVTFGKPVTVEQTDLLERPLPNPQLRITGNVLRVPVGHDKIMTLHITGLPDVPVER
ncbi:MAG TPA: glycoside hydrolase family 38 C-terminal domain-containing protein, partial [Chthonomonadales bacterium]|nr:glycoside hydrolase family 38 C-terminal domain-containing protein [Chthonomonadales bacterium]